MTRHQTAIWIAIVALTAFNVYILLEVNSAGDLAYESERLSIYESERLSSRVDAIEAEVEQLKLLPRSMESAPAIYKSTEPDDLIEMHRLEDSMDVRK